MDTLSVAERSERMRRIKSRDTTPELTARRLIHQLGYRFKLDSSLLPGRPDIVFPKLGKAIFVHGCFWHRHNHCHLARLPKSRLDFWLPKLDGNKARDIEKRKSLTRMGWKSLVIWECELSDPVKVMFKILVFLED